MEVEVDENASLNKAINKKETHKPPTINNNAVKVKVVPVFFK
jgi:hypothetical protein